MLALIFFGGLALAIFAALAMGLAFPKATVAGSFNSLGYNGLGNTTGAVVWDVSVYNVLALTATGNITLSAPNGFVAGQIYVLEFTQDATGGRTLTYSGITPIALQGGTTAPTATASTKTSFTFIARNTTDLYIIAKT